jgi:hypothetical protein
MSSMVHITVVGVLCGSLVNHIIMERSWRWFPRDKNCRLNKRDGTACAIGHLGSLLSIDPLRRSIVSRKAIERERASGVSSLVSSYSTYCYLTIHRSMPSPVTSDPSCPPIDRSESRGSFRRATPACSLYGKAGFFAVACTSELMSMGISADKK